MSGFCFFLFATSQTLWFTRKVEKRPVFLYENSFAGKIYRGISIDTVEVGGLTPTEAAAKLEAEIRYPFDTSFVFTYEGRQWQATPQQLGFHPQTADMTSAAYSIGRTGGLADQITERLSAILHGRQVRAVFLFDERVAFNFIT